MAKEDKDLLDKEDWKKFGDELEKLSPAVNKIVKLRLNRRRKLWTEEKEPFDCVEDELAEETRKKLMEFILAKISPLKSFYVIWNSLVQFYKNKRGDEDVEIITATHIRIHLLPLWKLKFEELAKDGSNKDVVIAQRELYCLLRLQVLRYIPVQYKELEFLPIFRFLYFTNSPTKLRLFMNEVLCDEFMFTLCYYLVSIYDDLEVSPPRDLVEFCHNYTSDEPYPHMEEKKMDMTPNVSVTNTLMLMMEDLDSSFDSPKIPLKIKSRPLNMVNRILETPEKKPRESENVDTESSYAISETPIKAMSKKHNHNVTQLRELMDKTNNAILMSRRKRKNIQTTPNVAKKKNTSKLNLVSFFAGFL